MKSSKWFAKGFVLGIVLLVVLIASGGVDRYTVTVEVSPDIYTATIDPNAQKDPIWGITPLAPEAWKENFGHNERTQLFFTCNELCKAVMILNKRVAALEPPKVDPNAPAVTVDPNEAKQ